MSDPLPDAKPTSWRLCLSREALLLVALVTVARLIYIAFFCPYNLVEDEAQYWVWSLRPDWSYYSKGPGIAWSIWLSTHALGVSEWGVRALAPIYSAIGALAIAGLSADAWRDRRAAFAGGALFLLIPAFILNGTFLMTIDGPMLAFWAVACWAGFRAMYRASGRAWVVLGLAIGIGFLFKYTIALLIPSLMIAAVLDRANLRVARPALGWIAAALVCVAAGLLPIAIWNQQNGWPAVAHFLGHAKLPGGDRPSTAPIDHYTPKWTFEFLGIQLAAAGPVLVLMWLGIRDGFRGDGRAGKAHARSAAIYLVSTGLTTLLFYSAATFVTSVEANWPVGGYVSLCAAAAMAVVGGMDDWRQRMGRWRAIPPADRPREGFVLKRPETVAQVAWHLTLAYGIIVSVLILRLDLIGRFPRLSKQVALHRLMGAPEFAKAIERLGRVQMEGESGTPLLISYHYGVAAQLTFYLPDHPMVFVAGSRLGYRRTQWDLWPDMSLSQPGLIGRNALLIGGSEAQWSPAFRSLTDLGHLSEDLRRDRWVYFGRGFLGFDQQVGAARP
ncbi:MAG: glycosyltransferase family 39 protein [Phycisphaeraceae bacterium]|nr:glycosyltransferase family 39 protein [Phycisphaeraceae bacterium]